MTRVRTTLTQGSSSATWTAPASSAAISPTYPASLATNDCVYALLHIKPDTATVAVPTNWSLVGSASGGSGAVGVGTGPTRMHLFKRFVPSGGLTGTETFNITGGSSPVGFMRAYRAGAGIDPQYEETITSWSVTTSSTAVGGTAADNLDLESGDEISLVFGTPTTTGTLTLTTVTATGATLGTPARNPGGTITNAQGNDISATTYTATVTAGPSTAAPVVAATANAAATAMGFIWRIRATVDLRTQSPVPVYTQPALVRAHYW